LWRYASNCNVGRNFTSIVYNSVNEHTFEGDIVTSCTHEEINTYRHGPQTKWLIKGSNVHNALAEVVVDKRLRKEH
jgi:hypothetical protein